MLPRQINADTSMQAAAPAIEVTRLLRLLGVGADVLRAFGGVLLGVAALSVFIALWNAVRERRTALAMLRMLGAPPGRVAGLVLCEALDESLTQQEGWIARYCHTRYRQEHMNDVAKKRAVLAAVRRQLDAMKP